MVYSCNLTAPTPELPACPPSLAFALTSGPVSLQRHLLGDHALAAEEEDPARRCAGGRQRSGSGRCTGTCFSMGGPELGRLGGPRPSHSSLIKSPSTGGGFWWTMLGRHEGRWSMCRMRVSMQSSTQKGHGKDCGCDKKFGTPLRYVLPSLPCTSL